MNRWLKQKKKKQKEKGWLAACFCRREHLWGPRWETYESKPGMLLVIQWLRLWTPIRDYVFDPWWGTKIPLAVWHDQDKKASSLWWTPQRFSIWSHKSLKSPIHPGGWIMLPAPTEQENWILWRKWTVDAPGLEASVTEEGIWRINSTSLNKSNHYLSTIFRMLAARHITPQTAEKRLFHQRNWVSSEKRYTDTKMGLGDFFLTKVSAGYSVVRSVCWKASSVLAELPICFSMSCP